jgi:putative glutamine amidotransferase
MRLELETRRFYLGRDYSEAVEAGGGLPVHIPLIPDEEYIEGLMRDLNGVLLPGADCDVDPAYYAEDPHPKLGKVIPEKDKTDRLVLEQAEHLRLPVLAICYGMQALNVWRGGSLVQDIDAQIEGRMKHRQGEPLDRHSHSVSIAEKNSLFDIVGKSATVNSHHHQAVRRTGRDLRAIAWANDGVIEAIEDVRPERFVLGVQWHPELAWQRDELSRGIFERFVAACTSHAEARSSIDRLTDGVQLLSLQ